MFKNLSKQAIVGLIFGVIAMIGISLVMAFTEPTAGPTGAGAPADASDQGDWAAAGRGWTPNASGDGSTALTKAACENASGWEWFEDGNGDGDTTDEEDGICVKTTTATSTNWGGTETNDNTYIAAYTCSGNFPNGTVATGPTDCALCVADCYDGKKDLPDQGGYTVPDTSCDGSNENCYGGPITPEVLKNWKGTRLPTANDFFGFCGATAGDANDTVGDSNYHSSGASASTTIGLGGQNVGRGNNASPYDEYMDLSNSGNWEWLSEQHYSDNVRVVGDDSCSFVSSDFASIDYRFRAVFRP